MSKEPLRLGKYELQTCIAHGGMGEVWKCLDTQLQRYVAIKLLHTERQNDPEFVVRFEREARLIASLRHPNIVKIHDFHVAEPPESERKLAYMVMDYVQGQTLSNYIRNTSRMGRFPSAEDIVYLFTKISLAIDSAHQQGMVHRDIKPANILLDQRLPSARPMGEPVLTDFGIARLQGVSAGTMIGSLLGTPVYISPEQAQGQHGDKRSDLYSLGIILYEITTGVTPFRGETTIAILLQHVNDMPTPPALVNPQISPALSAVILKSIAKSPEARFSSAASLTIALARALNIAVPAVLSESVHVMPQSKMQQTLPASSISSPLLTTPPGIPPYLSAGMHNSPLQPSYVQADPITPPDTLTEAATNALFQHRSAAPPQSALPTAEVAKPGNLDRREPRFKHVKPIYPVLAALLLIVLLGSGLGVFIFNMGQKSSAGAVGRLQFSRSAQAPQGSYDLVQLDIRDVPAPHGYAYYGWIVKGGVENTAPNWRLPFKDGRIHTGTLDYRHTNLLMPGALFLVTQESETETPIVPYTDPVRRLYYAHIGQSSSTTFDIRPCPTDPASTTCVG